MLSAIIENIPQLVFWKDKNGVFLGCNKKFSDSLGLLCPEDIVGKTDQDVTDSDNAKAFTESDQIVMKSKKPIYKLRQSLKTYSGEQLWFNINKVPLFDDKNEIIGVLGTMEDVTEQVVLEYKLRTNNEKYKSLIESTNTAYIILNKKLEIIEANIVFLQLIKSKNLYDCLGKSLSMWISPKYSEIYNKSFENLLNGKAIEDLELYLISESNEIVCVSIYANIIENGETKIFCLVRNIATRKTIESKKYISEQKKKDKLKQNLLALREQISKNNKKFE